MAMVVVLFPVSDEEPKLEPGTLEKLARLGVTSVALVRDTSIAGLVLEGWALDARHASQVASAVAEAPDDVRVLQPLVQMAFSATPAGDSSQTIGGEKRWAGS